MPIDADERPDLLVDTSVAVPLVVADHEHHALATTALEGRRVGLAGHAAFETFSVLTRLPTPTRRHPRQVALLLSTNFPATRFLSEQATAALFERLGRERIAGGAIYDALVAAVAHEHGVPLATSDLRAMPTYRSIGVTVEVLSP